MLKEILHGENKLELIFEYIPLDLKKFMEIRCSPLSQAQVKNLMVQLL